MRTTDGEQRVDVIYRRIDDEFLDPVHFRPDSVIGCAGVLNAARAGRVTIANAVGNGVADDKLLYTYVPDLIRYYLGEEPVLRTSRPTGWTTRDTVEWVLESLDQLVLKPVDGSGGKGIVIGPQADEKTLGELAVKVRATPRDWIAQKPIGLSTCPTLIGGRIAPRHVDLRPFAVNDGEQGVGAARRADPGGAAGGRAGRQLQPGRRVQGHLGAQPAAAGRRAGGAGPDDRSSSPLADLPEDPPAQDPGPARATPSSASPSSSSRGLVATGPRGTTC